MWKEGIVLSVMPTDGWLDIFISFYGYCSNFQSQSKTAFSIANRLDMSNKRGEDLFLFFFFVCRGVQGQ